MNDTTKIETTDLAQTTFGAATIGGWYMTTRGHRVQVVEVVPGDHAIVESRSGKQTRVVGDQVAFGPIVEDPTEPTVETAERKAPAQPNGTPKARMRDPRLPEVGTEITRNWRGHTIVARENPIGDFGVWIDDEFFGNAKSLTAAAAMALKTQGITSGVNGFAWFGVGRPAQAPRASAIKSVERLQADVDKLQVRFNRAAEITARLESELEAAKAALDEARTPQAAA